MELRNGVLLISDADSKAVVYVDVTRRELADFVLGKRVCARGGDALAELDRTLDRSCLMRIPARPETVLQASGRINYNVGLEH